MIFLMINYLHAVSIDKMTDRQKALAMRSAFAGSFELPIQDETEIYTVEPARYNASTAFVHGALDIGRQMMDRADRSNDAFVNELRDQINQQNKEIRTLKSQLSDSENTVQQMMMSQMQSEYKSEIQELKHEIDQLKQSMKRECKFDHINENESSQPTIRAIKETISDKLSNLLETSFHGGSSSLPSTGFTFGNVPSTGFTFGGTPFQNTALPTSMFDPNNSMTLSQILADK